MQLNSTSCNSDNAPARIARWGTRVPRPLLFRAVLGLSMTPLLAAPAVADDATSLADQNAEAIAIEGAAPAGAGTKERIASTGLTMGARANVAKRWLLIVVLGVALFSVPSQASADAWGNEFCATAGWSAPNAIVCVQGYMGSKDTTTKKQWIGKVRVFTKCGGCTSAGTHKLEAWGDGFYKSISYPSSSSRTINRDITWTVNRWLRSGTNVCGARTFFSLYPRAIACFAIKV